MLIFSQFRIWSKSCLKFLRQLFVSLEKIAIQVSTETFWRKNVLFLTDTKFSRLRTSTDAFLNSQRNFFCQFCQYGIQRIQRNGWMKFLSYKEMELFYHLWNLNEKSLKFLPENFVTVVQIVLACPRYVFLLFFCKNCAIFFVLFVFSLIQLHFRLNSCRQGLQYCTLRARGSFRGKTIGVRLFSNSSTVSGFVPKFFSFMAKTVRQPCQKCTFSASGTKRRKFCFEKMYQFSTFFWLQGGSFWTLSGIFQKIVKIGVFVSKEIFWIKICLSSKKSLRLVFKLWANHIRTFDSKFLGTIFRTAITCP